MLLKNISLELLCFCYVFFKGITRTLKLKRVPLVFQLSATKSTTTLTSRTCNTFVVVNHIMPDFWHLLLLIPSVEPLICVYMCIIVFTLHFICIQLLVCTSFMSSVNPYLHMRNIPLRTCFKLINISQALIHIPLAETGSKHLHRLAWSLLTF